MLSTSLCVKHVKNVIFQTSFFLDLQLPLIIPGDPTIKVHMQRLPVMKW